MIQKLLIANRGEIACRIMATCRRFGIRTVAVYSDADANALHVRTADEAVRIGPADAASSYLDVDAIVEAARKTGADAIHPGYGFLSERIALAEGCAANGIVWVGPSPKAIAAMGSKIESKRLAEAAGVPCVPGYHGASQDDDALEAAAVKVGFPVLVKASAGGGGRGMRRVHQVSELKPALALARAEAQAGFGDPALLIEKLIERPRHIEVQLAGDKHGNVVHLFERECSIQRNYQKVIEEAPAPNLPQPVRDALFDAALKLGRAIGYDSLGTVEFILDADTLDSGKGGPWFLEMNTRLQVEHPVTELITGLDLVEWQIRIAAGETLPLKQNEITQAGSAIEARLNAEDPAANYAPGFGTVTRFVLPTNEGVRVDTGIATGSTITPHYDSLLAKVIGTGADRATATLRLSTALGALAVSGFTTNQAFLRDIVDSAAFRAGALTTRFLAEVFPDGWTPKATGGAPGFAVAAAAWALSAENQSVPPALGPWIGLRGFRIPAPAGRTAHITLAIEGPGADQLGEAGELTLTGTSGQYTLAWAGGTIDLAAAHDGERLVVIADGVRQRHDIVIRDDAVTLAHDGWSAEYRIRPAIALAGGSGAEDSQGGGTRVRASLPGLIAAIHVAVDQTVTKGDTVVVLEAMKLMHGLPAPATGRVKAIYCQKGETVSSGAVLIEIEPDEPAA